jgi:hypothetical protein
VVDSLVPFRAAELARSGDHAQAWRTFIKLRSHGASLSYSAHHQLMVACLKVLELLLKTAQRSAQMSSTLAFLPSGLCLRPSLLAA